MKTKKIISCLMTLAVLSSSFAAMTVTRASAAGNIPAFPGAEGGGMYATGGRGGTVVHVTNLNDSGEGSFREAVAHTNRIVVFDVGGTINLKSDVSCASNVTIAGQTAPGGKGITLRGGKLSFAGSNIIVRFLSSRPGEKGSGDYDAWGGRAGCRNTIIDHCSIGWANDEQFGLYSDNENQTVQYTIIGPSNCVSYHSKGAHGFGAMYGSNKNTWHHNLLCHSLSRNFRGKVGGTNVTEFVNNVIYNWGYQTAYGTIGRINYVGNYLKMGPSTKGGQCFINLNSGSGYDKFRFYLTGNKLMRADGTPWSEAMNENNWNGGIKYNDNATEESLRINEYLPILAQDGTEVSVTPTAQTADEAFETVTSYAGTSVNPADNSLSGYSYGSDTTRTKIDAQVLYETRTGTGSLTGGRDFSTVTDEAVLDAINTYGIQHADYDSYYPEPVLQKEIIDSDNDGMPDEWELARGLDPYNPGDAAGDYLLKGYNNIEYYINDLTVNAFPEGVVEPSPELTELGDDYLNAKADADAIVLSPSAIKDAGELTLPTHGENGSSITWESGSSSVTVKNNVITGIKTPAVANEYAVLTATVTCGEFSLKKDFTITLLATPYKFDFGAGAVQEGFASVTASTVYSENSTYGFTSSSTPADMSRAPGAIPAGSENLYNDQTEGGTNDLHFKTELPNGTYYVTIHYGTWNDEFASIYEIEGVSSGNLASVNAAVYTAKATVTDGVLDVVIKKGNAKYGGYINGLEISTTPPADPDSTYHFDFGSAALQEGYTEVTAATLYSSAVGYGFDEITAALDNSARAASSSPAGQENLYADQVIGEAVFKVDVPNGKYKVTIHYGTWNDEFASIYEIEGAASGSLASTGAAVYTAAAAVTDGVLDIAMKKGDAKYGGYINGIDIEPVSSSLNFDFGSAALQEGYTEVTAATLYSSAVGYGFDEITAALDNSARAASSSPAGQENLYADQVIGEAVFKVDVPNGKYKVTIHYGTWNDKFASIYEIEGAASGSLASTGAAQYTSETEVKDGVLNIAMKKGDAKYGGYINGIDIIQLEEYEPEPDMPYVSELSIEGANIALNITSSADAPVASAIIAQYDQNGVLADVSLHPISGSSAIDDELTENAGTVKVFVWDVASQMILGHPVSKDI